MLRVIRCVCVVCYKLLARLMCLRHNYDGQNSEHRGHSGVVELSKSNRCPSQQSAGVAGREDTGWDEHTEFCLFWCGV